MLAAGEFVIYYGHHFFTIHGIYRESDILGLIQAPFYGGKVGKGVGVVLTE